jgi:hypothetical protein
MEDKEAPLPAEEENGLKTPADAARVSRMKTPPPSAPASAEPPSVADQIEEMAQINAGQLRQIENTRVVRGPLVVQQTFRIIDLDSGIELRTLTSDALNNGNPVAVVGNAEGWYKAKEALDGMFAYLEEDLKEGRIRATRKFQEQLKAQAQARRQERPASPPSPAAHAVARSGRRR